jgi:hypothetical protein
MDRNTADVRVVHGDAVDAGLHGGGELAERHRVGPW